MKASVQYPNHRLKGTAAVLRWLYNYLWGYLT